MLCSAYLINKLIDKFIFEASLFENNIDSSNIIINQLGNVKFLVHVFSNKEMRLLPNLKIDILINFIVTTLLLILVSIFIIFIDLININNLIQNNRNEIFI